HRGGALRSTLNEHSVTMHATWNEWEICPIASSICTKESCNGAFEASAMTETLSKGTRPFALARPCEEGVFLARDPLGVRPLYYGEADGVLAFASEVKALLTVTDDVNEFPPGAWYTPQDGIQEFARLRVGSLHFGNVATIASELRDILQDAVVRRIHSDELGSWLSGGLDSSVIAALARPHVKTLHTFVSGVQGAPDIEFSCQMAEYLRTRHHVLTVRLDDLLSALPDVIYYLESFDALLVRSSVTNYLTAKIVSDHVGSVFSGECGDELYAGYDYIKGLPTEKISEELDDIIKRLHNTALQRVDRCAHAHGVVPLIPFADMNVVRHALRIPSKYKIHWDGGKPIEKWILRKAFEGLMPDNVLWRPKAKFWQGTGVEDLLSRYASSTVSDSDFARERILPNGWVLDSKEELMYYRVFKEHFGTLNQLDWMGRTKRIPVV
ncbi:MAG TPA: asparagine synthase-related protein, partial [bacterium]|nr:asparagine synthase-related protein [bacterium]